ncbi:MAG: phosphoglycerate kinase [Dehalococcoidales bacterium]|nr:phosphoglycerate kinase [Dehalococcoidales bacterium]
MAKRDYLTLDDFDYRGQTVLLRVDINSPIDHNTNRITNENRIVESLPTIQALVDKGAKLVIIAHQGDTLDYQNLISLEEHARKLSQKLEREVQFIDDVAGPAAREKIKGLKEGGILLLDNLRYLTEEVSTFEEAVKLTPEAMTHTYLVRNLAPLFDFYVNDAFAAAHRNAPSMVAFQELLPSAAGILYDKEVSALTTVLENPKRPCVFLLGGAKISDAFGMMEKVLAEGSADSVLTAGVTGQVMHQAQGKKLGPASEKFINDRGLGKFIAPAQEYLKKYPGKLHIPLDFAIDDGGKRREISAEELPTEGMIIDIGAETVKAYGEILKAAGTIFVNGPAGVYEKEAGAYGTRELWRMVGEAEGYSVIGGGDTVASAARLGDLSKIDHVSTGGGALIRFLSGIKLPLLEAMKKEARVS